MAVHSGALRKEGIQYLSRKGTLLPINGLSIRVAMGENELVRAHCGVEFTTLQTGIMQGS